MRRKFKRIIVWNFCALVIFFIIGMTNYVNAYAETGNPNGMTVVTDLIDHELKLTISGIKIVAKDQILAYSLISEDPAENICYANARYVNGETVITESISVSGMELTEETIKNCVLTVQNVAGEQQAIIHFAKQELPLFTEPSVSSATSTSVPAVCKKNKEDAGETKQSEVIATGEEVSATWKGLSPVELPDLKAGGLYVLKYHNAFRDSPKGTGYFVISSKDAWELDGSGKQVGQLSYVRDYVAFSETEFTSDMVWKIKPFEDGYSLQSADSGKYLSMDTAEGVFGLYMSDTEQALILEKGSNGIYITKKVDGEDYYVRYTGGGGTKPGWVAQTNTDTRDFTLYEVVEDSEPGPEVEFGLEKLMPGADGKLSLKSGERYVFMTSVSGDAYALSSDKSEHTGKELRSYKIFDNNINTLTKDMVWFYGEDGKNMYLRSADTGRFLNITSDAVQMGWPSALVIASNVTEDGKISFVKTIKNTKYYLHFTSDYAGGFLSSSDESAITLFEVYRVTGKWPEEAVPQEFGFTWVHPDDKQIGDIYFFPFSRQMAAGNPTQNGVQTLTSNEVTYNNKYGRESKTFEYDLNTLDISMAFVLEPGAEGKKYALRSLSTGEYLNLIQNNLTMGEIQTLTLNTLSLDRVGIGDGAGSNVRFLAKDPRGWTTGSGNNYEFDMFRVNGVWPEDRTSEPFGTKWMRLKDMKVGDTLVFSSYERIVSTDKGEGIFALSSFDSGFKPVKLMAYVPFTNTADTLTEDIAWVLEDGENEEGYALRSLYSNQYLNVNVVNGQGRLELGEKQTIQLTTDANNRVMIGRNIDGEEYRVSFINENGGGWQAGTSEEYSQFNAWRITGSWPVVPDESVQREEPLMTIAAISDFHIDYDRQNQEQALDNTSLTMLTRIKNEDAPDVLLVGGDMTGNDGNTVWQKNVFDRVEAQLTAALQEVSDKVLYVNGDEDYKAGGSVFSSGAFIDSRMQAGVGVYKSALYEEADRASNLLAYYYEIDGVHFIGLNTPYNGDDSISGNVYTPESIEWVAQTLESIDREETIIFLSHYMLQDSRGMTPGYGISNLNGANDRLKEILLSYPNLLHLYGHDNSGEGAYISKAVFERITSYEADGNIQPSDRVRGGSFTSSFMGALQYRNNQYSAALPAEQPEIAQALLIYVYADRIELEMKNYGNANGERKYPFSYSIPILKPIVSEVYTVTETTVTDIAHGLTVGEFINNFAKYDEIVVRDLQGTVLTDKNRKIRNGMTVARISGGLVMDEKAIRINQAAEDGYPYGIQRINLAGERGTVYDMTEAKEITSVVVTKRKEDAEAGVLYVGIYDRDGSLLRSAVQQVTENGTIDVKIPLADCPTGAEYRIFMVDSLENMTLLSAPKTSREEYWMLDGLVPKDASTEMVACVGYVDKDDTKSSILVYDMNTADWNEEAALVWQWRPSVEKGFSGVEKYVGAADAKLRYSEFYGGYVVVTCSTKGFVGIVDYETGENLYSRSSSPENNTHAVELLPDGNMVAASTTGNTVTIYASSQGDGEGYYRQYTLKDAHGLLWDPGSEVLWALGIEYLRAYRITGTPERPELEQVGNYRLPSDGGHDLYAVYGTENTLWVTTSKEVYQFHTKTGEFTTDYSGHDAFISCANVKGVANQPFSGTIISMIPNNAMHTWNSDTVDLYHLNQDKSYTHEAKVHRSNAFYKVRAWYPNYRSKTNMER